MKRYTKGISFLFSTMMFISCNQTNIEGSWIEPAPGIPGMQQGFTLEAGGKASSINMATLQYEKWQQKENLLILSGKSIGNHQTIPFSDTLIIEKLTQDQLVLKQGELIRNFTKPAATLTPAKKIITVKGELVIGHESRSFTATGDTHSYWVKDDTNTLIQEYDKVTQGTKNGKPVHAELEVVDLGKSEEGFAANYEGVYLVTKVISLTVK